jgi:hypothetical protein
MFLAILCWLVYFFLFSVSLAWFLRDAGLFLPKADKFANRILFIFLRRLHDLHLTKTATAAGTAQAAMSRLTLDSSYCGVDDSDDDRGYDDYGLDDGENQPEDDFDDFMRLRPRQASLSTHPTFFS